MATKQSFAGAQPGLSGSGKLYIQNPDGSEVYIGTGSVHISDDALCVLSMAERMQKNSRGFIVDFMHMQDAIAKLAEENIRLRQELAATRAQLLSAQDEALTGRTALRRGTLM